VAPLIRTAFLLRVSSNDIAWPAPQEHRALRQGPSPEGDGLYLKTVGRAGCRPFRNSSSTSDRDAVFPPKTQSGGTRRGWSGTVPTGYLSARVRLM